MKRFLFVEDGGPQQKVIQAENLIEAKQIARPRSERYFIGEITGEDRREDGSLLGYICEAEFCCVGDQPAEVRTDESKLCSQCGAEVPIPEYGYADEVFCDKDHQKAWLIARAREIDPAIFGILDAVRKEAVDGSV